MHDPIDATAPPAGEGLPSGAAATEPPPAFGRLLNRDFVLLWQGQFVSQLGSQAFSVATLYWAMSATGSASLVGTLMMLSMLPGVVLGPFGGAFADRHSRRAIIIVSDLISGVAVLALAGLFFLRPDSVELLVAALFTVAVVGGVAQAFFRPAIGAAIPDLVPAERLAAANSLHQISSQVSMILGQGVGGVLFALLGAPALLLVDGLSFLFSAGSETLIRIPQTLPENDGGPAGAFVRMRGDLAAGLGFVRSRHGMLSFLFMAAAVNFLMMPVLVLLPFYADRVLARGAAWYGFLLAALGVGSLVGSILAGLLPLRGRRRSGVLVTILVAMAITFALLGQVAVPLLALGLMAAIGVLTGLFNVLVYTIFQLATPAEMRGRVIGLLVTLASAATPIGLGLGGVLGDLTDQNVPLVYALCGGLTAAAVLALGARPAVLDFLAAEAASSA